MVLFFSSACWVDQQLHSPEFAWVATLPPCSLYFSLWLSSYRASLQGSSFLFWYLTFLWIVGASFQGVPGSQEDKSLGQGPYFLSCKTKTRVICLIMCPGTGSPEWDSVPEGSYWITRLFLSRLFTFTNLSVYVKGKNLPACAKNTFHYNQGSETESGCLWDFR